MGPLAVMEVEWTTGGAVPFSLWEVARNSANGCPTGEVPIKGRQAREVWWEKEFWNGELGHQKASEQLTPQVQAQQWWLGHFSQSHGGHQCLTYILRRNHSSRFINSIGLAIAKASWKVAWPSLAIFACFCLCFFAILIWQWSYFWASFWDCSLSSHSWLYSCNHWRAGL